jgi:hypothetical protein
MKVNIKLDEENRIINSYVFNEAVHQNTDELTIDITDDQFFSIVVGKTTYLNGEFGEHAEFNQEILERNNIVNKYDRIQILKENLFNTDYQIIKCYEAQLGNEDMPYDLVELLAERKAWRDEINALEFELSMLG